MPKLSPERPASGLPLTLHLLSKTQNEAAIGVLIPALDSPDATIQQGALRAILDRRSPTGQKEVLRRLHEASQTWRMIIDERRGRMSHALRDGVLGADVQTCKNACQAILWFSEYDLVPALLTAMEDQDSHNADLLGTTLMELADLLYDELSAPRDYANRRDPQVVRRNVTSSLESAVRQYSKHQRREVVDAFLVLASRDNATLKMILQDPHHASYLALVDALLHNPRPGVMRLLLSFVDDPHAPSAAISVLARRTDRKFLDHLLRKIGYEPSAIAAQNLKRIDSIAWLRDLASIDQFDDAAQHSLVQLVTASGMRRGEILKTIERVLVSGKLGGRRAAARALAAFNGAEANALALRALEDPDPQVQAAIVAQLRQRGIPGALTRLIDLVDHPDEEVRRAARESLAEFNFERFVAAFDMLDDGVRRSTGALVKKVNPGAMAAVREELSARSRTRRLRAIGIAEAMQSVPELEEPIIALLSDEDHLVRAEAARVLEVCDTPTAKASLREALGDRSVVVQEAAERSLERRSAAADAADGTE